MIWNVPAAKSSSGPTAIAQERRRYLQGLVLQILVVAFRRTNRQLVILHAAGFNHLGSLNP